MKPAPLIALAVAAASLAPWLVAGCIAPGPALARFEYARGAMGTEFRIVLYADSAARADAAAAAAFARIDELEARLSDWRDDNELAVLARRSMAAAPTGPIRASDDLWRVLVAAQSFAERSGGAFDVTVGPLVQLWRRAKRQGELPGDAALTAARAATGFRNLKLDLAAHTVELLARGMRLDLGGIAKGDAAQAALAVLRDHAIERALVAAGGDIVVAAPPPGEPGWLVALAEIDGTPPRCAIRLAHAAVSTSGDTERYVEIGGRRFSHIVDPQTGLGLERRLLVSVVARDGMTADALATAVSVLGPEAGRALVESTPGAAARIVTIASGDAAEKGEARPCTTTRWPPMMAAPSLDERGAVPEATPEATGEKR